MAVSSMTGFARAAGSGGRGVGRSSSRASTPRAWTSGLRMPAPFDRVEAEARARLAKALARGTCFGTLVRPARGRRDRSANRRGGARIDRRRGARGGRAKPGLRLRPWTDCWPCAGWWRRSRRATTRRSIAAACAGALASVDEAVAALAAARRGEGEALASLLTKGSRPSPRWSRPPTPIRRAGPRRCASGSRRAFRR